MPHFCAFCGAQMNEGAGFCPACGTAVAQGPSHPSAAATPVEPARTAATGAGVTPNLAGLLCYIPLFPIGLIVSIVLLAIEPYKRDRFVRFHAFQSIFLAIACAVITVALAIIGSIATAITVLLGVFMFPVWGIFSLGVLILSVVAMIKAWQNEMWEIPYIGEMARKQADA